MASRRDLKKDINHMLAEVVDQCYSQLMYSPEINQESVVDIISDAQLLRKNLISKINYSCDVAKCKRKEFYHDILDDLYKNSIEYIERLNTIEYK